MPRVLRSIEEKLLSIDNVTLVTKSAAGAASKPAMPAKILAHAH
jgi:hypothetical protein